MWSWTDQKNQFEVMAQMDDPQALTLGYKNINLGIKKLETALGMPRMQEERTFLTVTTDNKYPLPERFINMDQLYSLANGQRWYADREYSEDAWRGFMRRPNQTVSDMLTNVFIRPGIFKFEIFPIPVTAGNTMTMIYSAFTRDLTQDDYTTGHIVTLANGGTTVTFAGETLTTDMAKRWLKTDDQNWYLIDSVNTAAHTATLLMPYQGTAIATGTSSFTIGEISRLPEGTHELPVHYALWQHFMGVQRDETLAAMYKGLWDEGKVWAATTFGNRYSSGVIPSQRQKMRSRVKNPNDYPDLSSLD